MPRKIKVVLIVIILILATGGGIVGCGQTQRNDSNDGPGTPTTEAQNYWPSNDGCQWIYSCKMSLISDEASYTIETYIKTETFSGTTELSSGVIVQNLNTTLESSPDSTDYYVVNNNGVFWHGNSFVPLTKPATLLAYPLEVGKTWTFYNSTAEVLAFKPISVPIGTFEAYKIAYTGGNFDIYTYYYDWCVNDIGRIKRTTAAPAKELFSEMQGTVVLTEELIGKNF